MVNISKLSMVHLVFFIAVIVLHLISIFTLNSITPSLFPIYFVYIVVGIVSFFLFYKIDFEILTAFSKHFYVFSLIFLALPIIIGQVTRGVIRWIPIGEITIQPSELVRPFLILFLATYLAKIDLNLKRLSYVFVLLVIPLILILVQPSLGVTILTLVGFIGVFLASTIDKKYIFAAFGLMIITLPIFWLILAPYQKQRISTFLDPQSDPLGVGYNSIQSMISVGSGGIAGRGLGKGVQTQLAFLPERHTDFVFASISEEMGLVGSALVLVFEFIVLWSLIKFTEVSKNLETRMFITGLFLTYLAQTTIHVGMNMGILPITGIPLPLVSAGGSSLVATMMALGMAAGSKT
jgi:rod shape determining protein RodA